MQVILLNKVLNLGGVGDTVQVKPGYARNYLIPQGKAVMATESARKELEARRAELEKMAAQELSAAEARAAKVKALGSLILHVKASEDGHLFGSITPREIAEALAAKGIEVERKEIDVGKAIRELGEYEIAVHFHGDVVVHLPLTIVAEDA
ncbi:MAG TPA: 50S ribosomal protein L9 [Coxiellaceae bacterium]|nr:50S ribosomal protein L9 [Coxiellaceae bacterium]